MRKILTNTLSVSFAALISRILGVSRDVIIAMMFGANLYSDLFFLCFRIPDFLRKMFSEGVLSSSFVPVFLKYHTDKGEGQAFEMAHSAFIFVSFLTTVVTIFGIIFAPFVIGILVPESSQNSYEFNLAALICKIMMPYLIFISLLAVCMGILNSLNSFKTPAFAPIVFNIVIIFFALIVSKYFNPPVIGLAIGVTTGGFVQLLFQIPLLIKKKVFRIKKIVFIHPGVIKFMKNLFPTVIGASTFHINLLVITFFALFLEQGNITYFYYADRLVQLPMALVSASLSIVFLPLFSKNSAVQDKNQSLLILLNGLKFVFFIIIPAMAGLIALRESIVTLFFHHGAFDLVAVKNTSTCLLYLVSGLWAYTGTRVLVSFFHAFSDTATPLKAGILTILINFILSLVLMKFLGFIGLVLSISISGAVNFLVLFYKLNSSIPFSYKDIAFSACRAVFVSGIMYFVINILMLWMDNGLDFTVPIVLRVAILIAVGILVYTGLHLIIKSPEIKMLRNEISKS